MCKVERVEEKSKEQRVDTFQVSRVEMVFVQSHKKRKRAGCMGRWQFRLCG
jgi:hypothetical protein